MNNTKFQEAFDKLLLLKNELGIVLNEFADQQPSNDHDSMYLDSQSLALTVIGAFNKFVEDHEPKPEFDPETLKYYAETLQQHGFEVRLKLFE